MGEMNQLMDCMFVCYTDLSLTLDGDMVRLPQISYLRGYCVIGEGLGLPVKDLSE